MASILREQKVALAPAGKRVSMREEAGSCLESAITAATAIAGATVASVNAIRAVVTAVVTGENATTGNARRLVKPPAKGKDAQGVTLWN